MRPSVLLSPVAVLLLSTAQGQSITLADMPIDGQHFQFIAANYVPITTTGANVTWDLSALTPGTTSVVDCVLPGATGYETDFPTASMAFLTDNIQQFVRFDANGMYLQGLWNGYSNALVKYTDEYTILTFPFSYNSTFTDNLAGGYDVGADHVDVTGNVSFTADGYGTLVLPWGTITNVLKVTGTEHTDEVYMTDDYGSYTTITCFYKPGVDFFLLKAMDITTSLNDEPTGNYLVLNYMSQTSAAGIDESQRNAIGIDAYPVPAHDRLNVVYGLGGGQATTLALMDASGRTVRSLASVTGATGLQRTEMDVAGLAPGLYLLQITDARGQRGTRQVVLE